MKTLCVIFGGANSEHEVSLRSAEMVLSHLDREQLAVVMVGITKEGRWLRYTGPVDRIPTGRWEEQDTIPAILSPDPSHKGLLQLEEKGWHTIPVDVAFGVLHGKNGEDGTIQGLFELAGIPYVGSGVLGSAVCMDKGIAHALLVQAGVPKTRLEVVLRGEEQDFDALEKRLSDELGYPMYVKPANAGSSVGVTRVERREELPAALELALLHDHRLVVEQEVIGQEVECAVMGNDDPIAAQVLGEIAPTVGFYDYNAKYQDDTAQLYIPARLEEETAQRVREIAVRAYRALECKGLSRVDFFVKEGGEVILNEINTIPGFTSISMYPKLFEASGISNGELIARLLEYAQNR